MRPIKFRAWDNLNKEMYYLDAPRLDANLGTVRFDAHRPFSEQFWLMQFTGLLDKSGKEIYEGDILQYVGIVFPVTVDDFHGYRFMHGKDQLTKAVAIYAPILGNIHEHPALLGDSGWVGR